jgi:hypothetical protein
MFRLNALFGGVTDPDPTIVDAENNANLLIAVDFCRVEVRDLAFKMFFSKVSPMTDKNKMSITGFVVNIIFLLLRC